MRNDMADRIWERHQARSRRNRKIIAFGSAGAVAAVVMAVTLYPRPALAVQDVAKATKAFRTISWKQLEAGTIRDLGSSNPKTVAAFSKTVHHYVSLKPMDIQLRVEPSKTWKGLRKWKLPIPFKQKDGSIKKMMMPAFGYYPGPAKNLTKDDMVWHTEQVLNSMMAFARSEKQEEVDYLGRPAIKFHLHEAGKYIETDQVMLADAQTKRLVYRKVEVKRLSGEQLFIREQSDFVYDAPRPH